MLTQSGVTLGGEVAHCWAGQYGCSDMVIQKDVAVQKNKEPKRLVTTIFVGLCTELKHSLKVLKDVLKLMLLVPHSLI